MLHTKMTQMRHLLLLTIPKWTMAALFALVLGVLAGCTNTADRDIRETIDRYYTRQQVNFRIADSTLLSSGLHTLVRQTADKEKYEAEKTRNGPFPTDKPLMIEGDIFTSIYEGQDKHVIKSLAVEKETAKVQIEFSNTNYNMTWNDEIRLVKEKGAWRIDDVVFKGKKGGPGSTRQLLEEFLKLTSP
jgi:hypothetical protein